MNIPITLLTLVCLWWSFHFVLLEGLMMLEDLEGSGSGLEYSGSGDWSEGEWKIESFSLPNIMDPENSQYKRITASSSRSGQVTKSPGMVTTSSHAKDPSQGPKTITSSVVDMEPNIVKNWAAPKPPAEEEETWLPSVTLQTPLPTDETGIHDSSEEDMESGDGAVEMSTISLTTVTERRDESVFIILEEDKTITNSRTNKAENEIPDDSDITFDLQPESTGSSVGKSQGLLERKEVLAGVVGGLVVGLVLAVALLSLMVYAIKKDEGNCYRGYQRAQTQEENIP